MLLGEILKSVTGDDGYPGDTTTSENWPGVAPGTRGILNALSPKYCNWAGIVDLDPKPPILWTHGTHDIVVADGSPWEMGTLGSLGVVPGLARRGAFPPQPMVAQIRARARALRGSAAGASRSRCSRAPATSRRSTRASAGRRAFFGFLESVVSHAVAGLVLTDHELQVPLDHADPDGEQITVFAREVAEPEGRDKPFLVFLQGGPGFEASAADRQPARPGLAGPRAEGLPRAAARPARHRALDAGRRGREPPTYLKHFRADSIVRDAELLRDGAGRRAAGACSARASAGCASFTYLSLAPGRAARGVDDRRRAGRSARRSTTSTAPRGRGWSSATAATTRASRRIASGCWRSSRAWTPRTCGCPSGDRLTARRLRTLGNKLGMSDGPEALHYVLELPFGSPAFLHDVADALGVARNPIYALLHEACWADGGVTNWSAERTRPATSTSSPECFTGEHILPWMFEDYGALAPRARRRARARRARVAAAVRPGRAARATRSRSRPRSTPRTSTSSARSPRRPRRAMPNLRAWVTSEYDHNGLRVDGERILARLIDLVRGRA